MFVLATVYHDTVGGSEILQPFGMHDPGVNDSKKLVQEF